VNRRRFLPAATGRAATAHDRDRVSSETLYLT
jgi:hypothetical protein